MTRTLAALLALAACGPDRDQVHDLPCEEMPGDWIDVPEVVEMPAQGLESAKGENIELDGQGSVCAVSCTLWEKAGIYLHRDAVYLPDVADGSWDPAVDDVGEAVVLPGVVAAYSANGAEVGDVSVCTLTSTAGEDVIEVVIVE